MASVADTVFLSLPNPEIVQSVALGQDGVIEGTRVKRVVDFSTIGPRMAGIVATALAERKITYVDAPVSGGLKGAREGTLAVMVACPKACSRNSSRCSKSSASRFISARPPARRKP